MLRAAAIVAAFAVPTLTLLQAVQSAPSAAPAPCNRIFGRSPLATWTANGSSFVGSHDLHLSVYSDGYATISKNHEFLGKDAAWTFAPIADVQLLHQELAQAGAATLCDFPGVGSDLPLHTLTFFPGGARTNTFSFYVADGAYSDVQNAVQKFIQNHFPSFF